MYNSEFKTKLLLSAQRALLGAIYPEIIAIAVGSNDLDTLLITTYLDKIPESRDYDVLSDISAEILADIEFSNVEEKCEYTDSDNVKLDDRYVLIYKRQNLNIE